MGEQTSRIGEKRLYLYSSASMYSDYKLSDFISINFPEGNDMSEDEGKCVFCKGDGGFSELENFGGFFEKT